MDEFDIQSYFFYSQIRVVELLAQTVEWTRPVSARLKFSGELVHMTLEVGGVSFCGRYGTVNLFICLANSVFGKHKSA